MSDGIDRRRFLGAAAMSTAAMALRPGDVVTGTTANTRSRASFKPLKQIDAGLLNVGYAEDGPTGGQAVILLHGWPYDIHSYVDVAPLLAAKGYRVIVPYLRGYGTTRFLSSDTMRNGQQSVVALDIIALMDALKIQKAVIGGFDWGSRTTDIMAALWPDRCKAMVSVSGYLITNVAAQADPLPPAAELGWWYQYYFSTDRGRKGYDQNRDAFNKLIWKIVSPKWAFDDATYDRTAPDITVPTITIGSDFDGANIDGAAYAKKFTGKYAHRVLRGIGHNVPQEAPHAFADAIVAADALVARQPA